MISQSLTSIVSNPLYSLLVTVLAIASITITVYIYFKSRKVKIPCYAKRSVSLIRDYTKSIEGLSVAYNGKEIENLTAVTIWFWNNGRGVINKNDVAETDPFRIMCAGGSSFLQAEIVRSSTHIIEFKLSPSLKETETTSCFWLDFAFLRRNDGAVIQLLVTGKYPESVLVVGTVPDGETLKQIDYEKASAKLSWRDLGIQLGATVIMAIGAVSAPDSTMKAVLGVLALVNAGISIPLIVHKLSSKSIPSNLNPKWSTTELHVRGRTGQPCEESGVYKCSEHPSNTIPLSKGEKFPPCSLGPGGGHAATWVLVRKA